MRKTPKVLPPIRVVPEDRFPLVAPNDHVVQPPSHLNPQRPRHLAIVPTYKTDPLRLLCQTSSFSTRPLQRLRRSFAERIRSSSLETLRAIVEVSRRKYFAVRATEIPPTSRPTQADRTSCHCANVQD